MGISLFLVSWQTKTEKTIQLVHTVHYILGECHFGNSVSVGKSKFVQLYNEF